MNIFVQQPKTQQVQQGDLFISHEWDDKVGSIKRDSITWIKRLSDKDVQFIKQAIIHSINVRVTMVNSDIDSSEKELRQTTLYRKRGLKILESLGYEHNSKED